MSRVHPIIEVFFKGKCWSLDPTETDANCTFGGPLTAHAESKVSLRKAVLHHLGAINLPRFGVGSRFGFSLPLLYGICHEGCELAYCKKASNAIEVTSLEPKKVSPDYPYPNYPTILPYYQLGIASEENTPFEELIDRLGNTGWGLDAERMYIIVMQHPHIGHSLFEGDDDLEIIFEFDPRTGEVRSTSQCG